MIDSETYRKMTDAEKRVIEEIESKAKKRKHKVYFTRSWLVDYLCESFKDWSYDTRKDAVDMVKLICDLELYFVKAPKKTVDETRKMLMEKVEYYYPKEV